MLRAQAGTQPKKHEQGFSVSYIIKFDEMKLSRELGRGGFGVVYQGTWRNRDVAVKQLLVKNLSDESKQEFESEAWIMANLKASNIVQFYGYCVSPERCLVMEYMPKGSLYSVLHSSQPLEWAIKIKIAMDMAVGVSILHAENVIHRDIKSLNVLLDENFKAKLTDFGLSKVKHESQSIPSDRGSAGTPAWMAPELTFEEGGCTKASDIYSLGITFWELVSRDRPFKNVANPAIIPSKVNSGYRDAIPADCPSKLATLISACWDTQPQRRPKAETVVMYLKSVFDDFSLFLKSSELDSSGYRDNLASLPVSSFQDNFHSVNPAPVQTTPQVLKPIVSTSSSTEGLMQELVHLSVAEEAKRLQLEKEHQAEVAQRRQAEEKLERAEEELQRRENEQQLLLKQQAEKAECEKAEQARLAAEMEKKRLAEEQAMRDAKQRQLFFKQQTETVSPQVVSALLKHVAEGEQDKAEALLKETPALALAPYGLFSSSTSLRNASLSQPRHLLPKRVLGKLPPAVAHEAVKQLLRHVACGEQDEAEALIKKTPALVLSSAEVKDLSGRFFSRITAFQYAVWALDWHMWTMIRKYLSDEQAQGQAQGLITGTWVKHHGSSVSWQNLLDALQKYSDMFSKSQGGQPELWVKDVGSAQLLLPAHVINEYCRPDRPFYPCPDFSTGTLPRSRKTVAGEWFTPGLGNKFAFFRFNDADVFAYDGCWEWMCPETDPFLSDRLSCHSLLNTRAQQRDQLFVELLNYPQASLQSQTMIIERLSNTSEQKTSANLMAPGNPPGGPIINNNGYGRSTMQVLPQYQQVVTVSNNNIPYSLK